MSSTLSKEMEDLKQLLIIVEETCREREKRKKERMIQKTKGEFVPGVKIEGVEKEDKGENKKYSDLEEECANETDDLSDTLFLDRLSSNKGATQPRVYGGTFSKAVRCKTTRQSKTNKKDDLSLSWVLLGESEPPIQRIGGYIAPCRSTSELGTTNVDVSDLSKITKKTNSNVPQQLQQCCNPVKRRAPAWNFGTVSTTDRPALMHATARAQTADKDANDKKQEKLRGDVPRAAALPPREHTTFGRSRRWQRKAKEPTTNIKRTVKDHPLLDVVGAWKVTSTNTKGYTWSKSKQARELKKKRAESRGVDGSGQRTSNHTKNSLLDSLLEPLPTLGDLQDSKISLFPKSERRMKTCHAFGGSCYIGVFNLLRMRRYDVRRNDVAKVKGAKTIRGSRSGALILPPHRGTKRSGNASKSTTSEKIGPGSYESISLNVIRGHTPSARLGIASSSSSSRIAHWAVDCRPADTGLGPGQYDIPSHVSKKRVPSAFITTTGLAYLSVSNTNRESDASAHRPSWCGSCGRRIVKGGPCCPVDGEQRRKRGNHKGRQKKGVATSERCRRRETEKTSRKKYSNDWCGLCGRRITGSACCSSLFSKSLASLAREREGQSDLEKCYSGDKDDVSGKLHDSDSDSGWASKVDKTTVSTKTPYSSDDDDVLWEGRSSNKSFSSSSSSSSSTLCHNSDDEYYESKHDSLRRRRRREPSKTSDRTDETKCAPAKNVPKPSPSFRVATKPTKALRRFRKRRDEYMAQGGVGSYDVAKSWTKTSASRNAPSPASYAQEIRSRKETLRLRRTIRSGTSQSKSKTPEAWATSRVHRPWSLTSGTRAARLDTTGRDRNPSKTCDDECNLSYLSTQVHQAFAPSGAPTLKYDKSMGRDRVKADAIGYGMRTVRRRKFAEPDSPPREGSVASGNIDVSSTNPYGSAPRVRGLAFGRQTSSRFARVDDDATEEGNRLVLTTSLENPRAKRAPKFSFPRDERFDQQSSSVHPDREEEIELDAEAAKDRVRPHRGKGHRYVCFDRQTARWKRPNCEQTNEGNVLILNALQNEKKKGPAFSFARSEKRTARISDERDEVGEVPLNVSAARDFVLPRKDAGHITFAAKPPRWTSQDIDTSEGNVLDLYPEKNSKRRFVDANSSFTFNTEVRFRDETGDDGKQSVAATHDNVASARDAVLPSKTRGGASMRRTAPRWEYAPLSRRGALRLHFLKDVRGG